MSGIYQVATAVQSAATTQFADAEIRQFEARDDGSVDVTLRIDPDTRIKTGGASSQEPDTGADEDTKPDTSAADTGDDASPDTDCGDAGSDESGQAYDNIDSQFDTRQVEKNGHRKTLWTINGEELTWNEMQKRVDSYEGEKSAEKFARILAEGSNGQKTGSTESDNDTSDESVSDESETAKNTQKGGGSDKDVPHPAKADSVSMENYLVHFGPCAKPDCEAGCASKTADTCQSHGGVRYDQVNDKLADYDMTKAELIEKVKDRFGTDHMDAEIVVTGIEENRYKDVIRGVRAVCDDGE